ncbi:MAG: FAD-dependent oxidoreductase, partial [Armatimonadota bacterium]
MQGVALLRSAEIAHRYEFRTVTLPGESVELSLGHALGIPSLEDLDSSPARVRPDIKEEPLTAPDYGTDIVIIGAGPAGYVAAIRAAQLGGRVVVVEKSQVGGVCLNIGCVATLDQIKRGEEFGIKVRGFDLDIPTMMARKERIVKQLTSGVEALFRKNKVRLVRGLARIVDPHTISVQTDGGTEQIRTRAILIATGSIPAPLPVPGLELGGNVWTSTEAL